MKIKRKLIKKKKIIFLSILITVISIGTIIGYNFLSNKDQQIYSMKTTLTQTQGKIENQEEGSTVPTITSVTGSNITGNTGTITVTGINATGSTPSQISFSQISGTYNWEANTNTSFTKTVTANGTWYVAVKNAEGTISAEKTVIVSGIVAKVSEINYTANNFVKKGGTTNTKLTYNGTPKTITYSSSKTTVATVSDSGIVTGVAGGSSVITATLTDYDGTTSTVSCNITVTEINLSETSGTAYAGHEGKLITITGENYGTLTVEMSNSNIATATVSGTTLGVVPAETAGTATITVKESNGGATATYSITVLGTSISLNPISSYNKKGTTLTVPITGSNMGALTVTTSNNAIATATVTGNATTGTLTIQAIAIGKATITVKEANGNKTAIYTITVTSLDITPTSVTLDMSGTKTQQLTPSGSDYGTISYESNNTAVATVNSSGLITGVANGVCTITATGTNGNITSTANVKVETSPSGISITGNAHVGVGKSTTYKVQYTPTTANVNTDITCTSSNTSIATINSSTGEIKGIAIGTSTITAKAQNNVTSTKTITVTSLTTTPTTATLDINGTKTQQITPGGSNYGTLSYASSDEKIATVNSSGLITGVANGNCTITATEGNGGATATVVVTVQTSPSGISIDGNTHIGVGKTTTYKVQYTPTTANVNTGITWTSSNTNVATINSSTGVITGVATGTSTITAKTANNKTDTKTITVTSLTSTPTTATLDMSGTKTQQITTTGTNNGEITYTSSNTKVATVSSQGLVTGIANGTATITATEANGGATATVAVTVQTSPTGIELVGKDYIGVGATKAYTVNYTPVTANANKKLTWSSSDTSVATVDSSTGVIKGLTLGHTIITAKTENNLTTSKTVEGTAISGTPSNVLLDLNNNTTQQISVSGINYGDLIYSSSDTKVATVSDTGLITGVADGKAIITVTETNGEAKKEINVTVETKILKIDISINGGKYLKTTDKDVSITTSLGYASKGYKNNSSLQYNWSTSKTEKPINWYDTIGMGTVNEEDIFSYSAEELSYIPKTAGTYYLWARVLDNVEEKELIVCTSKEFIVNYAIEYDANGGKGAPDTQEKSEDIDLAISKTVPTKEGYVFKGWTSSGTTIQPGAKYTANKPIKLIASWTPINYYISYNGNGSTAGSIAKTAMEYDKEQTLSANTFEKKYTLTYNYNTEGKTNKLITSTETFLGWSTNNSATKADYTDKQSVKNLTNENDKVITLYAIWEKPQITLENPTREGYTFKGWSNKSDGSTIDYKGGAVGLVNGDMTLYAVWEANGDAKLTSPTYTVDNSKTIISKVSDNTTVNNFLKNITAENVEKTVIKKDDKEITGNELIGTGSTITVYKSTVDTTGETYTIEVANDITGDGLINVADLIKQRAHVLGKVTLIGAYKDVADTNADGSINVTDITLLRKTILEK